MKNLIIVSLLVLLSSCASQKSLYHWGSYESLLFDMYVKPDKAQPVKQITVLTKDIRKAQEKNMNVAPGIYAHLGMMYAQTGDPSSAVDALKMEKKLFPESQVMIDGLISRAFPGVNLDEKEELPSEMSSSEVMEEESMEEEVVQDVITPSETMEKEGAEK